MRDSTDLEKTISELLPYDGACLLLVGKKIQVVVPQMECDTVSYEHVLFLSLYHRLLADKNFIEEMMDWFDLHSGEC